MQLLYKLLLRVGGKEKYKDLVHVSYAFSFQNSSFLLGLAALTDVNPQARGLCFRYDLHNYNDTQAVGKAGVNDNQDIVPDNLVIPLNCLTEHNPQSIHPFFPK